MRASYSRKNLYSTEYLNPMEYLQRTPTLQVTHIPHSVLCHQGVPGRRKVPTCTGGTQWIMRYSMCKREYPELHTGTYTSQVPLFY